MIGCLDEASLLALAIGDDTGGARAHVRACTACAARLAALEADLDVLRRTLGEEPMPATVARRRRRQWLPLAAAVGASAVLTLLWIAPRHGASRPVQVAQLHGLAQDVSAALFASESAGLTEPAADSADFEAALNGGWRCGGLERYGVDCRDALDDYE